ncbi:MAG: hypothetical protein ACKPKO_01075, partial [Candidatus Fonsibacter sp.]
VDVVQLFVERLLAADQSGQRDLLELQNDLLALIKRKNRIGHQYFDKDNILKQGAPHQQDDLFVNDNPPQPEVRAEPPQPQ